MRSQPKSRRNQGFTIIEVALVLAIAALIFLVVFLAVPALQRNQRTDARKRDTSNVAMVLTTYLGNHPKGFTNVGMWNGQTNGQDARAFAKEITDQIKLSQDQSLNINQAYGKNYSSMGLGTLENDNTISVWLGQKCQTEGLQPVPSSYKNGSSNMLYMEPGSRGNAAVAQKMEIGRTIRVWCQTV
jgi:prepilin-type N-terminal cleavage/methylation domain-containing protein